MLREPKRRAKQKCNTGYFAVGWYSPPCHSTSPASTNWLRMSLTSLLRRRPLRNCWMSLETIGAGEGNRTLVISLEGHRRPRPINGFSEKIAPSGTLRHIANSRRSEWRPRIVCDVWTARAVGVELFLPCLRRHGSPLNRKTPLHVGGAASCK